MQQIINFIIKNKNFILFLLLLSISISLTIQSHSYHKSKFITSANWFTGGLYGYANNFSAYIGLNEQNQALVEENQRLRNLIHNTRTISETTSFIDSTSYNTRYLYRATEVYKNSYNKKNNIILLGKGRAQGVLPDMGVITSKGVIGIIENVSDNYATVISILNSNSKINAKFKNSEHFGTLAWKGGNPNIVQLIDIEKMASFEEGDTIVTGGHSTLFPKGILIGKVKDYVLDASEDLYTINIELFNDMTSLNHVYIIENLHKPEIDSLLSQPN